MEDGTLVLFSGGMDSTVALFDALARGGSVRAKNLAVKRRELSFQELLVGFLYTLMRDDVVPGRVEKLVMNGEEHPPPYEFSNPHLEAYARELAARLMGSGT